MNVKMTKLKGCLSFCAVCIVVGGAFYVFCSSRKGVRIRHSDEEDSSRRGTASSQLDSETNVRHMVVPETFTLAEQRVTTDHEQDAEPRSKQINVLSNQKSSEMKQNLEKSRPTPSEKSVVTNRTTSVPREEVEKKLTSMNIAYPPTVRKLNFDPYGLDSLVVIHIQKTGGSDFLRHLITATKDGRFLCILSDDTQTDILNNSLGSKGIRERGIMCPRDATNPSGEQWLVSEKNLGWICQVHASYSEYKVCLSDLNSRKVNPHSRFLYSTILRHPVLRYLSEYFHFKRNATWGQKRICGGEKVTETEMPPCYPGFYTKKPWPNLTIDKFLLCKSNWANNRQTRMLADMESLGCYGNTLHPPEEKDHLMLESAKRNLRDFAFFGLTEYQNESCALFEHMFDVKLKLVTEQRAMSALHSAPILQKLWNDSKLYDEIAGANRLDMQLYEYALQLFTERVRPIGFEIDPDFVSKEIVSMKPEDLAKTEKKLKKFKLHEEFKTKNVQLLNSDDD